MEEIQQVTPTTTPPQEKPHEALKSVLATVLLLVAAPIIAVVFTLYVFQSYEVDGPSMQNTLHNKDRLIVYKLPRTVSRLTKHAYIPNRGDVIIFQRQDVSSGDLAHEGSRQLIKRVIGLPGERVVVSDGKIRVYNKEHPEGFDPDAGTEWAKTATIETTSGNVDLTVPENEVFVSGDNRPNSLDSRYFGPVNSNDIIGKLVLRLWPSAQVF
jgi:signal peptidase I